MGFTTKIQHKFGLCSGSHKFNLFDLTWPKYNIFS